ncbi:MAG: tetratricopeptide repeat-containing sensor histidine kinase [Prolixibacteraceae bacterium]
MKTLWLFLGLLFFSTLSYSQSNVDSLLRLTENAPQKQKAEILLELSSLTRDDTAKSNAYAREAYQLARKLKQIREQAISFLYLGETCYYSIDYDKAIPNYEMAIPIFTELGDTTNIYNCYNSIGLCYHYLFRGEKAIANYINALKYCENNLDKTAELYSNIGMTHNRMNNFDEAVSYYQKALKINLSIHDSASIAVNYNGIGDLYANINKHDSAVANFNKALEYFKKLKRSDRQAIAMANLASEYENFPDSLNKALDYFEQAWKNFQKLGWNHFEVEIRQGKGSVYNMEGRYAEAIAEFNESLRLTDLYNRGYRLKKLNYEGLSETYQKIGNYKKALENYILCSQYNDSVNQKEKYQQIVSLEKQYETEKKENEIVKLQAKQQLTDIQLQKNKQLKQLGFITATLLLVFAFYILIKYFDKLKLSQLLELKNKKIEESEQELRVLNAAKNKFFSIIAHDLKNPFHTVMGYSWLLSKDYERFTEDERRKFAFDIHHSTNNIFRLLQNLLEWSRSQTGRLKFSPMEVEFKRVLENSLSVMRLLAEDKNISLNLNYTEDLKIFADPLMIETVLRNLINNAIKFTPEFGQIEIKARQIGDEVSISVTDSGIGISPEDAQNLFRIDSKVKRKGTNNEDGSGLGLILCKEFVEKNEGVIWVNSTPGEGSSFSFTIRAKALAQTKALA